MNIFTDILFLFVYILAMLYLEMPNINNTDYPIHKLYLFISIFSYYFIIQLIKKIKNKCTIDALSIMQDSLIISLFCVLGYSIYVDLKYWEYTKDYIVPIDPENFTSTLKGYLIVSSIIAIFVMVVQFVKILFGNNINECNANSYAVTTII